MWRDVREGSAIGRRARLELEFATRHGRTVIVHSYAEPPFRVRSFDMAGAAGVIIVCSGPGVFPGDRLQQSIHVGPGARALLTSQAALQVHPGNGPPAAIRHEYRVDGDGELQCHWDPMIPFTASSVSQQFCIDADAGSRLYWSDAMMAGRLGRGEAWQFAEVGHDLQLRIGGELKYLERFRLAPRERPLARPWIAGGAGYFATNRILPHFSTNPSVKPSFTTCTGVMFAINHQPSTALALRRTVRRAVVGRLFHEPDLLARK